MTSTPRVRATRLLHWELNVRDLARSIAFYEALTPLRATKRIDDDRMRSSLLRVDGSPSPALRLVEWRDPATTGDAHDSIGAIGFTRVVLHVADLDGTRAVAESLGVEPVAPTTDDDFRFELGSRGSTAYRVWSCLDPDGIVVEFLENPVPKVSTVAQGTGSLERAVAFLTDELGLRVVDTVATTRPMPNVYLPGGDPVEFHGVFLRTATDAPGYLDVLEHRSPAARHPAYPHEHHVGVIRCVLEADGLPPGAEIDLVDPEGVRYRLVATVSPSRAR